MDHKLKPPDAMGHATGMQQLLQHTAACQAIMQKQSERMRGKAYVVFVGVHICVIRKVVIRPDTDEQSTSFSTHRQMNLSKTNALLTTAKERPLFLEVDQGMSPAPNPSRTGLQQFADPPPHHALLQMGIQPRIIRSGPRPRQINAQMANPHGWLAIKASPIIHMA